MSGRSLRAYACSLSFLFSLVSSEKKERTTEKIKDDDVEDAEPNPADSAAIEFCLTIGQPVKKPEKNNRNVKIETTKTTNTKKNKKINKRRQHSV